MGRKISWSLAPNNCTPRPPRESEGVVAPRAHRVHTVATTSGQTPVNLPKMQPIVP